jgi:4-hydroxybenzoate polyprenyltransferase
MNTSIKYLRKFIDLIFYSNLYIAIGAVALTLQTQLILFGAFELNEVVVLVFFATMLIYALHRLVGLYSVKEFLEEGRFYVINTHKSHIWVYAVIAFLGLVYSFFQVNFTIQMALVIPGLISFGYVLPFLGIGKKRKLRLRDLNWIKIFLIAVVWAYVTVILPILDIRAVNWSDLLIFIERALFIFMITLPFDIRDLKVDKFNNVKTIPAVYGIPTTMKLVLISFILLIIIIGFNYLILPNEPIYFAFHGLLLSLISTYIFIRISIDKSDDYYFTGLLDGTMWIQFLLVWLFWYSRNLIGF